MIDRINLILKANNITARQFAEEIGIQPSGMSHILGGRNNPSLDFVTKVINRYPEIDANWLLLGRGAMITNSPTAPSAESLSPTLTQNNDLGLEAPNEHGILFSPRIEETKPVDTSIDNEYLEPSDLPIVPNNEEPATYEQTSTTTPHKIESKQTLPQAGNEGRRLVKLLFIYSDNTFEECIPTAEAQQ